MASAAKDQNQAKASRQRSDLKGRLNTLENGLRLARVTANSEGMDGIATELAAMQSTVLGWLSGGEVGSTNNGPTDETEKALLDRIGERA